MFSLKKKKKKSYRVFYALYLHFKIGMSLAFRYRPFYKTDVSLLHLSK